MINAALTMLIIGALLGVMLGVAAKVFYVKVDEREAKVTPCPRYFCITWKQTPNYPVYLPSLSPHVVRW